MRWTARGDGAGGQTADHAKAGYTGEDAASKLDRMQLPDLETLEAITGDIGRSMGLGSHALLAAPTVGSGTPPMVAGRTNEACRVALAFGVPNRSAATFTSARQAVLGTDAVLSDMSEPVVCLSIGVTAREGICLTVTSLAIPGKIIGVMDRTV